jgi:hypothetical protein
MDVQRSDDNWLYSFGPRASHASRGNKTSTLRTKLHQVPRQLGLDRQAHILSSATLGRMSRSWAERVQQFIDGLDGISRHANPLLALLARRLQIAYAAPVVSQRSHIRAS